jgi:hypothetical protein
VDRLWGARRDFYWRQSELPSAEEMLRQYQTTVAKFTELTATGADQNPWQQLEQALRNGRVGSSEPVIPVSSLVADACEKLDQYLSPYFEQVLAAQG